MATRRSARPGRVVLLLASAASLVSGALAASCTLAHPLDEYHAGPGLPAGGEGGVTEAGDSGNRDAGDGCEGDPQILTPASGATVGASIRLTASAPRCIMTMILYVDGVETLHFTTSSVDQDVPVAVGSHTLNINGWAGTAQAHSSPHVQITRPK
ncbi:MAG: hypothetical protein JWO86_9143 [Myxococcaceae bacterium]|jgi:hypothetical protein|nr:hypothetical protein [Myxococcaceae bacterium]MEA2745930.1 hypothetical protein [Myxococcales bacterium]